MWPFAILLISLECVHCPPDAEKGPLSPTIQHLHLTQLCGYQLTVM